MSTGFWLKAAKADYWIEVSRDEFVRAERAAGFVNTLGDQSAPATSAFTGVTGSQGQTFQPKGLAVFGRTTQHMYFDHYGHGISVERWAELRLSSHLCETRLPETGKILRTVYLGVFVPELNDGLFGTAVIGDAVEELEHYDNEVTALLHHQDHVAAIRDGYHCAFCRDGRDHQLC